MKKVVAADYVEIDTDGFHRVIRPCEEGDLEAINHFWLEECVGRLESGLPGWGNHTDTLYLGEHGDYHVTLGDE